MSESISPWITILGLLPFAIGTLLFLLYLIVRNWQTTTGSRLGNLRSRLRGVQLAIRDIQREASTFSISIEDPEPYGAIAEQLTQGLVRCENFLANLYRLYADLHERVNALKVQGKILWLGAVNNWYHLDQDSLALENELVALQDELETLSDPLDRLRRLGWETASRSRVILEQAQCASALFGELNRDVLIEDPVLDFAWQDAREWEETLLAQIPIIYLHDNEQAVTDSADKETTAHVYRVIKIAEPAVQRLFDLAGSWQSDSADLANSIQLNQRDYNQVLGLFRKLQEDSLLPIEWEKTRGITARITAQFESIGPTKKNRSLNQLRSDLLTSQNLHKKIDNLRHQLNAVGEQKHKLITLFDTITLRQEGDWLDEAINRGTIIGI